MTTKIRYSEPDDYFPKEIREKYFADEKEAKKAILKKLKDTKNNPIRKIGLFEA
jgi:hypothetical protein